MTTRCCGCDLLEGDDTVTDNASYVTQALTVAGYAGFLLLLFGALLALLWAGSSL